MPPTKRTVGIRELRVGLLVLGTIVVLVFLILNASGDINPFKSRLHLLTDIGSAEGLRKGTEVRLAGVRVGKVDNVEFLAPSDDPAAPKVRVTLAVDKTIGGRPATERIRSDSTVQFSSPSLLGNDKIVEIVPGTSLGQPARENQRLRSTAGGGIDQLTASGNELVDRLNKLSDQVNGIVTKINAGQGTLGRVVNDEALYDNLNAAIRQTDTLIRQIQTGQGTAGKLINDPALYNNFNEISVQLRDIATNLRNGRGTAGKLLTDEELYNRINRIADRADRSLDNINTIVANVQAGHGTIGRLLNDEAIYNDARAAIARFNTTAERIDSVVAGAQRGEGTVGKLLTDDKLYSNINDLSSEGVKMIYDFRQNPKKYLTIKFQLF